MDTDMNYSRNSLTPLQNMGGKTKYAHYRYSIEKIDVNSGEVMDSYKSIKQAAEENGLSRSLICMCCNGKCKSGGGYEWRRKI